MRQPPIRPVGVDCVSLVFSLRQITGEHDAAACRVSLHSVGYCRLEREAKNRLEHFHDVVVSVLIIIENDDVKQFLPARVDAVFDLGQRSRHRHFCIHRI